MGATRWGRHRSDSLNNRHLIQNMYAFKYYPFNKHIRDGFDVNTFRFERGETPLMHAAAMNHYDLVVAIIDHGVDLDERDDNGQTALMYGIFNLQIVEMLIAKGANVRYVNNRGWTALDYAKDTKNANVIKMISDAIGISDDENDTVHR